MLLVMSSATFSASETALFSLSRFQLKQFKLKSPKQFLQIQYLLDRPAALVATILIGNECANVMISHLLAVFFDHTFQGKVLLVTVLNILTVTPIIFIFGEITPRIIAARNNASIIPYLLPVIHFAYKIVLPVRWFIEVLVNRLTLNLRHGADRNKSLDQDDFLHLVEDIKNKGAIEKSEQDLIENVFDIDDDNALELATPLREFLTVVDSDSVYDAIQKLKQSYSPRIPVLNEKKEVVGILYAKDLLKHIERPSDEILVTHIMKSPLAVPAEMKAEALFKRFRQLKVHIAIVEDKTGMPLGIVTMEDILEQLFGELWEKEDP